MSASHSITVWLNSTCPVCDTKYHRKKSQIAKGQRKYCNGGCYHEARRKPVCRTVEYKTWKDMRGRCSNLNHVSYKNYGARGIMVCQRWLGEGGFASFLSDVGMRPSPQHSIDRIDNDGNYEPGNVRWATWKEQCENQRQTVWVVLDGVKVALKHACKVKDINYASTQHRMKKFGMTFEEAMDIPRVRPGPGRTMAVILAEHRQRESASRIC